MTDQPKDPAILADPLAQAWRRGELSEGEVLTPQPMTDNNDLRERAKVEQIDRAKAALRNVPNFWQRFNDWTSDRTPGKPFEICRYGQDGDEIVVVHACASQAEADEKHLDAILEARATAALSATPIAPLQQQVERLEVALRGLLSSYIGTCRFNGRVISEIEQHHCVIDARAALGDDVG